jgi:hypothetical protein
MPPSGFLAVINPRMSRELQLGEKLQHIPLAISLNEVVFFKED